MNMPPPGLVRLKPDTGTVSSNCGRRRVRLQADIFFVALAFAAAACSSSPAPSGNSGTPMERSALRPVSLPDLSSAAPPVQAQIREQYASLTRSIDNKNTPAADLAGAYGDMGALFMATEFLDAADRCFLNARDLVSSDMRWPYYLGHVERFKNEPAKAAEHFERTLMLEPDYVPALVWLGEMRLAQGQPELAEPLFARALTLKPGAAAALYGAGRAALAKRDYAQSVKHLEAALALAPQASRIQYPLAMAYRGLGDRARAEEHLRLRGNVEPPSDDRLLAQVGGLLQNAAAYEVRGSEALDKRQWGDAVTNLRKAIELAPDRASTRLNLGTALYLTGDAAGALEQFETAVRLAPEMARAHFSIGVIMEAGGRDNEAIERFSTAVKYEPNLLEARLSLADALRRNRRFEESLTQYAEIIKLDSGVSQARFGYAMALVSLHRYQQARNRLTEDMKTYADQPGIAHALARLFAAAPDARVRNGRAAMAIMEQLLRQQKTIGLAETMAMTFAELGRFDEAVSWQRDAIAEATRTGRRDLAGRMTANLDLYTRRQPCRTPWREDDPVFFPRPAR
jgi:tetratricopeptide (TPR) repeat protein